MKKKEYIKPETTVISYDINSAFLTQNSQVVNIDELPDYNGSLGVKENPNTVEE